MQPPSSNTSPSAASAPAIPSTEIDRILSFWFSPPNASTLWFQRNSSFDAAIADNFTPLVLAARAHHLDHWTSSARGSLALIILLDQFPRNIFRGSAETHASDARACEVAIGAIAREFDRAVDDLQALFFYLPLMHDETLVSQIACIALSEALAARCQRAGHERAFVLRSIGFAKQHRDTILRFGRFPSRNEVLGRQSTEEEREFLKLNPAGWVVSADKAGEQEGEGSEKAKARDEL